jgi:hypothetical protein
MTQIAIKSITLFEIDIQQLPKADLITLWRWVVNEAMSRARNGQFEVGD